MEPGWIEMITVALAGIDDHLLHQEIWEENSMGGNCRVYMTWERRPSGLFLILAFPSNIIMSIPAHFYRRENTQTLCQLRWNQWALWICSYQIGSDLGQVNPQKPTCLLARRHAFVSGTQGGVTLDPATCASCVASCALTLHRWDETWSPGTQDVMLGICWISRFRLLASLDFYRNEIATICFGVWYHKNTIALPQLYSWINIPRPWSTPS